MFDHRLESYWKERSLITAIHQGDEQAFNQIFKLFYPVLCLFANRFLLKRVNGEGCGPGGFNQSLGATD